MAYRDLDPESTTYFFVLGSMLMFEKKITSKILFPIYFFLLQVTDAVKVYELLVEKKKTIPDNLKQSLLESLAFYSEVNLYLVTN